MKKFLLLLFLLPLLAHSQINLCTNTYSAHATINLTGSGKIIIRGDSINALNSSTPCIRLTGYDTVIIKRCKLINSAAQAILLTNIKYIVVDSCYMANVSDGVHDNVSTFDLVPGKIIFTNNYVKNINGPFPLGNAIQLNQVHAHGVLIANNYIECIDSVGRHPQDILSIYKSAGYPGDSIMVVNNFIRGGQVNNDSGGAAGIVLNDVGGSYQVARNNMLVNPGAVGIQVQGGHNSKVDHNSIYGDGHGAISFEGLQYGNYASDTTYAIEMSYNKIYWRQTSGTVFNRWVDKAIANSSSTTSGHTGGPTLPDPIGWATNTGVSVAGAVATTIVPTPMLTVCATLPAAPVIAYSPSSNVYVIYTAITNWTPSNSGGAATSWSISPALPSGLSFNPTTGVIYGTTNALSPLTLYTITASNLGGSGATTVHITVNPAAPLISYSPNTNNYLVGSAIAPLAPNNSGGTSSSWAISPSVPTGLAFSTATGVITGTPTTTASSTTHTVTASNATGGGSTHVTISVTTTPITPGGKNVKTKFGKVKIVP